MVRKPITSSTLVILAFLCLSGCASIQSFTNLLRCDFRVVSLKDTKIAGIDVQHTKNLSEIGLLQAGAITTAYLGGSLPLDFTLNIEAKNPNDQQAELSDFDWIVSIDDVEMARGTHEGRTVIPGQAGTAMVPLIVSIDLMKALHDKSKQAMLNFGLNLADAGDKPTRVSLKIRPTVYINGNTPLKYPGYISVGTEFGGTDTNK